MKYGALAGLLALLAACGDENEGAASVALSPTGPGPNPAPPPPPSTAAGPHPFDDARLTSYRITLAQTDWDSIVADPFNDTWRRCNVEWEGRTYADCALRPAGDRSRIAGNPKPSFRVKFDEFVPNREFHKFSSIKFDALIHDRSMMRARLEYPVYVSRGVPAPQYVHCRMYVNGAYKGLYGAEERVSKEFLRKRFGTPVNQLYEWTASGTMHDVLWAGWDPATNYAPRMWIPEIEELPPDAEGVRSLCYALNNDLPLFDTLFEVDSFLNFIAVETLLGEGDNYVAGPNGTRTANIKLCKVPATGKYMILPSDCDQGFFRPQNTITDPFQNRILTRNLILWSPANLSRYKTILRELIQGPFATSPMHARVDYVMDQIRQAAVEDPLKPYGNDSFEWEVQGIKSYIANRNSAFSSQVTGP